MTNHWVACLVFPIKLTEHAFIEFDLESPNAPSLQYQTIDNLEHVYVLPTSAISPQHALIVQKTKPALRVSLQLKRLARP